MEEGSSEFLCRLKLFFLSYLAQCLSADWTSDDKLKLLEEMKQQCPAKDNKSFTARVGKLDWGKVQVEGRTPQQCQEAWAAMVAKVVIIIIIII